MPDDLEGPVPADDAEPPALNLPQFLRSLTPDSALKGWLLPLFFALATLFFWDYSHGALDPNPRSHGLMAVCFAVVTVLAVLAKGWVEWRVRRARRK
ncbi:hypothetical protein [Streptacidiphilus rugosus]|uniref:hypothetical protein n=1 Tax=Streptacidiphilus rugosus TaxID=405783 RepID=UPI000565DF7D|nr:hypothetical protein [Streptacidiphilus rugosus]